MKKLFILGNPAAGSKQAVVDTIRDLEKYLTKKDVSYEIFLTTKDDNGEATVRKFFNSDFTDLVIVGGDGTINEGLNGLQDLSKPISILPRGTGNDFVKNFDIGKTKEEQFKTVVDGIERKVDLGYCNGRRFANGIGIGFDGQIVKEMLESKTWLWGHAAYYQSVLKILSTYKERSFEYQIDDQKFSKDLFLLTIANGTTFGGGFKITPNAVTTDGLLDVCEIGRMPVMKRFLNIPRMSNGTHLNISGVEEYRAKKVIIDEQPDLVAHLDGEYFGTPPFEITIGASGDDFESQELAFLN